MNAISSTLSFRSFVPVALSVLTFALVAACGGSSTGGDSMQRVKPGDTCTANGQQAPSEDGCNTCTCSSGSWACTEKACPTEDGGSPNACTPGTTTNDGCNECSCVSGQWACTNRACPPPPACKDGDVKQESCNTCTCMNGAWGCTKMACPPDQCKDGDTMNDGCNSCACYGGQWACTARYCPPPQDAGSAKGCGGWLGNTCSSTEYCAYVEGQLCGAADASAFCAPRPGGCDKVYNPVCGCDGKTHGNSCDAAIAGTGVMHAGVCK